MPSVCARSRCLYHLKLFIRANQEMQPTNVTVGKGRNVQRWGKVAKYALWLSGRLEGRLELGRTWGRGAEGAVPRRVRQEESCLQTVHSTHVLVVCRLRGWAGRGAGVTTWKASTSHNKDNENVYGAYDVPDPGLSNNLLHSDDLIYLI